jgi:hypothetical protein
MRCKATHIGLPKRRREQESLSPPVEESDFTNNLSTGKKNYMKYTPMFTSVNKQIVHILVKSIVVYAISYLLVGAIAYQLLTKQFYVGDNPLFAAYLRSESNPAEWAHTNVWIVPGLLLRALLISLVLLPFMDTLKKMAFWKRTGLIFALMFVLIHLAAAAPSPSNIEGFIYMKPELFNMKTFLLTQPEMIFQSLLFAIGLSWVLQSRTEKLLKR